MLYKVNSQKDLLDRLIPQGKLCSKLACPQRKHNSAVSTDNTSVNEWPDVSEPKTKDNHQKQSLPHIAKTENSVK